MQRPFFSQSPNSGGSGPVGPPTSTVGSGLPALGCLAGARTSWADAAAATEGSGREGTFGTGPNSARIAPLRPHETPAKTKMSTLADASKNAAASGLGVLAFRGPDAAKFLQGQLSADTEGLAPGTSTLAGLHNPQGRVIAILALSRTSAEEFLAELPRE